MNFKEERKKRDWTLAQVAEQVGYSVAAINGIEKNNEGGYRLRVALNRLFGNEEPIPYSQLQDRKAVLAFREEPQESELEIWRRRAKAAEKNLADMKRGMRELLESNSLTKAGADIADILERGEKSSKNRPGVSAPKA